MADEQARQDGALVRDADDHDLLTFGETGIRLRAEIELVRTALREELAPERRGALETRLRALTSALERHARQAAAGSGEQGFLDYPPPPPPPGRSP